MTGRTFSLLIIAIAVVGVAAAVGVIVMTQRGGGEPDGQAAFAELPRPSASGGQTTAAVVPAAPAAPESGGVLVSPQGIEMLAGAVESGRGAQRHHRHGGRLRDRDGGRWRDGDAVPGTLAG